LRNEIYCTVYVYVVIYFCDSLVLLSGSESVQVFNRLFIYLLLFEIHLSLGKGWDPNNRLTQSHLCDVPS